MGHRLLFVLKLSLSQKAKPALTCSDKYRSIAISNVIGKILDHVIIDRQSECLKTCDYQFGFKPKASTVLCSTMVNETIQYYTKNDGNPVYLLLLDATKAFDKVSYKVLFDVLLDKKVCPRIVNLLYYSIVTSNVMSNGGMQLQIVLVYQMV